MSPYAPIALFVYNRPKHTKLTVEALLKNKIAKDSVIYIFADAAKNKNDIENVNKVRSYIKNITGFLEINIIERTSNLGLASSLISGVSKLCLQYQKVIVVEDDLITSPYFLKYMNDALAYYEDCEEVVAIDGYMYPTPSPLPETFFTTDPGCWGWATWQRGWSLFEEDGEKLLSELKSRHLENVFDYNSSYPYTKMLEDQTIKKNNSWAIRWYASVFLKQKLTLHVGTSLVQNIGNDKSGSHGGETNSYLVNLKDAPVKIGNIPLNENISAKNEIIIFFSSIKKSFWYRLVNYFSHRIISIKK